MAQTRAASTSRMISEMADPDYTQAFYKTANSDYCGTWHDGTRGDSVSEVVPTISDVLGARPTVRKPVRPLKATAKCVLANKIQEARNERLADKVLSADVIPKKYPVTAENFNYPPNVKHGADNPLYSTSSQAYGSQMPMSHQISDRYFPSTNLFTKEFVETKPRFTGLTTHHTSSKVHKALDTFY
mmetsp:Transcript_29612/g.47686  ORF Transcript_29612/g.47686 Transcript_29612/m.47686 type:complete len:186 (-) Transcript_29612:165-722(-)